MSMKNPVTLPGIDPGTVRLVTQRLNHYTTRGPNRNTSGRIILKLEIREFNLPKLSGFHQY
jgi:hypothetical protein